MTYDYDVNNRRVSKTVDDTVNTETEHYVWDNDHHTLTLDDSGDAQQINLYGDAVDLLFATETDSGDVFWSLADNQNTVRDVVQYDDVNDETDVVVHRKYDIWGNLISETNPQTGPVPENIPAGYTGREWDADAELYYYRARWYDPVVGRFVSEDPIGFGAGSVNTSSYVANDTPNAADPSGLVQTGDRAPRHPLFDHAGHFIGTFHPLHSMVSRIVRHRRKPTAFKVSEKHIIAALKEKPSRTTAEWDSFFRQHGRRDFPTDLFPLYEPYGATTTGTHLLDNPDVEEGSWPPGNMESVHGGTIKCAAGLVGPYVLQLILDVGKGVVLEGSLKAIPAGHAVEWALEKTKNGIVLTLRWAKGKARVLYRKADDLRGALRVNDCDAQSILAELDRLTVPSRHAPSSLPGLDKSGKVHGALPRPEHLGQYDPDDLRALHDDLGKSIEERIRLTVELGRDRPHGVRHAVEEDLRHAIERHLDRS